MNAPLCVLCLHNIWLKTKNSILISETYVVYEVTHIQGLLFYSDQHDVKNNVDTDNLFMLPIRFIEWITEIQIFIDIDCIVEFHFDLFIKAQFSP